MCFVFFFAGGNLLALEAAVHFGWREPFKFDPLAAFGVHPFVVLLIGSVLVLAIVNVFLVANYGFKENA